MSPQLSSATGDQDVIQFFFCSGIRSRTRVPKQQTPYEVGDLVIRKSSVLNLTYITWVCVFWGINREDLKLASKHFSPFGNRKKKRCEQKWLHLWQSLGAELFIPHGPSRSSALHKDILLPSLFDRLSRVMKVSLEDRARCKYLHTSGKLSH